MKKFIMPLMLLASTSVFAGHTYLAEELMETTTMERSERPFCVSWANVSMSNSVASYNGNKGAGYRCSIDFAYRERVGGTFSQEEKVASRNVVYNALPTQHKDRIADRLEGKIGFLDSYDELGNVFLIVPNAMLGSLYTTANLLSEVFGVDIEDEKIRLTPKFNDVADSKDIACNVIALELLDNACEDSQDSIKNDIVRRIKASANMASLRKGMIPKKSHK